MTVEKLNQIRDEVKPTLELRLSKHGAVVYVGAGDCGIEKGSREVLSAVLDEVAVLALKDVIVTQMGCIGECDYEPIVTVRTPDGVSTTYGKVTPEIAKEIISSHISGGKVVEKALLANLK